MDADMFVIRPFETGDQDKVEAFFAKLGGESRAMFDRSSGNRNNAMRFFEGKDVNTIRWLMLDKDRMIGYVFLWDLDTGVPMLGIGVAEDYQGKHLGRTLMQTARDYAVSLNKGGIMLTTHLANVRGQGLYERSGYERIGMHTSGEALYLLRFR